MRTRRERPRALPRTSVRQGIHQVQIEIGEIRRAQFLDRAVRVLGRMDAAQNFERARGECLRSQRHSIDACIPIAREAAALDGSRIRLQGDLGIAGEFDPLPQGAKQTRESLGAETGWACRRRRTPYRSCGSPAAAVRRRSRRSAHRCMQGPVPPTSIDAN